jgi:signal transduction histidine kinase
MSILSILNLQNWDLLAVGISIAAIGILGFLLYFKNPHSITNKSFLLFAFFTIVYGIFNYASYHTSSPFLTLWLLRFTIFSAVWHAYSFFQLFYVFPNNNFIFGTWYRKWLFPLVSLCSLLTLTPFVFKQIDHLAEIGQVSLAVPGPAIPIFGLTIVSLIIGGIISIFRNIRKIPNNKRAPYHMVIIGTIITFVFILTFNFILPVFFNNRIFIPLAPVFILPFVLFTAYSIMRYHLLNTKIIATELLTFLLAVVLLFEILLSTNVIIAFFRFLIFLLVLVVGILLIRSVRKEVEQRELLETLTQELAAANEKLKTLDLARAEFISIASHQLRTPPATVKWYLSAVLANDYGIVPKEIQDILKKTELTNNHLISLIEDMLNVSRIERGKMEFLFEPTNVEELARFAYEQLVPIATDKKLKFTYTPPPQPLPSIMADKEKLRQVMNNLIDNALKYTKEGEVAVKIFQKETVIQFEVTDSGKGISKEDSLTIFQKYTRGKESIKQSAGLGLGLYVAKIIIEQHKGKIWAESRGVNKGSAFMFSIPIKNGLRKTTLVDLAEASKKS